MHDTRKSFLPRLTQVLAIAVFGCIPWHRAFPARQRLIRHLRDAQFPVSADSTDSDRCHPSAVMGDP